MDRGVLGWVLALNLVAIAALFQRFGNDQILTNVSNQVQQLVTSFRPAVGHTVEVSAQTAAAAAAEVEARSAAALGASTDVLPDSVISTSTAQLPEKGPYSKGRSCGLLDLHAYVVVSERVVLGKGGVKPAAVYVEGGKISKISEGEERFKVPEGMHVINFTGGVVSPGVIDVHVHLNEPGREEWEGISTGTAAAAAGGVTLVVDMPLNSFPTTTTPELLRAKQEVAKVKAHVNNAHWAGLVPDNAGNHALLKEMLDAGALGFKAFMSPSGIDDFAPVSIADIKKALPFLKREGVVLFVHAELVSPVTLPADADPTQYSTFLANRPASFEQKAITALIKMLDEDKAEHEWGFALHIAHLSDASSLPLLKAARARHPITVETCAHYLKFSAEFIPDRATLFACMPPIRSADNQLELVEGLKRGDITIIASDHSPAPAAMKKLDTGNFLQAWGGISSLQYLLPAAWTSLYPHGLDINRLAVWLSGAPSRLAGVSNRKGSILVGHDADLVIWDPTSLADTGKASNQHKQKESPYNDVPMYGKVLATIVNGDVVFLEDRVSDSPCGRLVLRGGEQMERTT